MSKISLKNILKKTFKNKKTKNLKSKKIKNNFYIELSINKEKILLPVGNINKSNVMNILSCLSVLDCLGLNHESIKNYFKKNFRKYKSHS